MNRLIERIMIRFNRGDDYILTSQDKWQLEVLQEAGFLLEDIQKEIAKRTKQQEKEIAEAFEEAGVTAIAYDDKIYEAAGLSPIPLMESPYMIRLMQRTYDATLGEWKNFTRTIAQESQQLFIRAMDKAYIDVASGNKSYTQAFKEAINDIINDGVYVRYDSGHKDTIETATLRCVRTGISQMSASITDERMKEMDWDIILVSSHLGARVTGKKDYTDHSWWQGKFYSKSGKDKRFPPYSKCGQGKVQGIHGANCRHSHGPGDGEHNPFEHYDSEENLKAYETQQRQRELERRIRNTKRQVQGMQTAVKNCKNEKERFKFQQDLDRKSYLLQKQNKAYTEFCKEHDLKELRERLQIARWDRKQAAMARGAAARYKNAKGISEQIQRSSTIEEANDYGTKMMAKAYETHRLSNNLLSEPYHKDRTDISVYYGKMDLDMANTWNNTLEKLINEYDTPLSSVRVMTMQEAKKYNMAFAATYHNYASDTCGMLINPAKCNHKEKLADRIMQLGEKKYSPKVPKDKAHQYVAIHEFAHTLADMESKLIQKRNGVNADYGKIKKFRSDIQSLYDEYKKELIEYAGESKIYEKKSLEALIAGDLDLSAEYTQVFMKAEQNFEKIYLGDYSRTNSDEFFAEAFTNAKIGVNKNKYSDEVLNIVNKYFRR